MYPAGVPGRAARYRGTGRRRRPVIGYLDPQQAAGVPQPDLRPPGGRVLDHVGQRLGYREVAGRLDREVGPSRQVDVDLDGQRSVQGQGLDSVAEAAP